MTKPRQTGWEPPRGITLVSFPSRPAQPYGVQWRIEGKRKTKTFPTREKQIEFAKALAGDAQRNGTAAFRLNEGEAREWRAFRELVGKDTDLALVAACWERNKATVKEITVADAIEKFKAIKKSEGIGDDTYRQIKKKSERLVEMFGALQLHQVTTEKMREWLKMLSDELDFEAWTVKDHLKIAVAFFNTAKREKWCAENPCDPIKPPKIAVKEINVLTVAEMAQLFEKNKNEPCVGRLALEAFGGLRFSSAGRLVKADLKFNDLGIELPATRLVEDEDGNESRKLNHKSERRHYIDGLPANLWEWLKIAPAACWEMTERQYLDEKGKAFVRAGVTSTPNCLRHSFGTYHVAGKKDAALTAVLMQHTNPAILYKHYKGRATAADGEKYFQIIPSII